MHTYTHTQHSLIVSYAHIIYIHIDTLNLDTLATTSDVPSGEMKFLICIIIGQFIKSSSEYMEQCLKNA